MRTLSAAGLKLIKKYEGYHTELDNGDCLAYLDTLAKPNVWTIGYGVTKGVYRGMRLTESEASAMFMEELHGHEKRVNQLVTVPIAQPHFDALVSFDYNTGGLGRSTLLKKLNRKDYDGAQDQFRRWVRAGGKVYRGLVRRRLEESNIFAMGTEALFDDETEADPIQWVADSNQAPHQVDEVVGSGVTRTKVAVGTGVAAGAGGAAANAPPSTWEWGLQMAGAMGQFAMANVGTVLAIGGVIAVVAFIPHLNSYRLSK